MKKHMLNLIAVFALFVLSACGGGGGTADTATSSTSVVPSSAVSLSEAGGITFSPLNATAQSFSLQVSYVKNLNDNYLVSVDTQSIEIAGCTIVPGSVVFSPSPVVMDGNTNSIAALTITGQVDSACANTSDYTLTGDVAITLGDQTTHEVLSVSSVSVTDPTNPTDPTDPTGISYALTGVTTPVIVNYDNEIKDISVYVVDENGVGVADQNVSIQAISDAKFGAIVSATTVQTDTSGKASFVYQAPADVKAVDGNTTIVDLLMTSNGVLQTKSVEIMFNKIDENEVLPVVVVDNQYRDINLTSNSQTVSMEIRVFESGTNAPYTQGTVKVKLPSKVLDGVDVGFFAAYEVPVGTNGIATFAYTGPRDIIALVESGDLNSTFDFYHVDNPSQGASITVHYEPNSAYQPSEYFLTVEGNHVIGLNTLESFTVYFKDDTGALVDSASISSLSIKSMNTAVGSLIDQNTTEVVPILSYTGTEASNSKPFYVQTNTLSGLLPLQVDITFTDANGNEKTLGATVNLTVLSGPPTALSISYVGVEHNATIGKFVEKFAVTATDAYNNPVNTRPYIATGAMVEYAVDGSSATGERTTTSPRLWHGMFDSSADILQTGTDQARLVADDPSVFQYIDVNNDKVVLFGAGYVYEALGKWDISSASSGVLDLADSYYGSDRTGLYFAVGHNNRQDLCSADGREYVGNMKSNTYQIDENGHALIEFEYDYHLTGKDIMVWVNLTGFQADTNTTGRIGEAQKHTLRGMGFVSDESYTIPAGGSARVGFSIHHKDIPEWYKNGHFGYAFAETACTVTAIVDSSNAHDARDCNNIIGYVIVDVANNGTADCTIELNDESIAVAPEFEGVTYP